MNLQELKDKFRHKTKADLSDIDLALQAAPFLVRKIESMESELSNYRKRIEHLEQQLSKKRPSSYKGSKNGTNWQAELDDKNNRIVIVFSGSIDHRTAKLATNSIHPVFSNMRKGCDVIFDVSGLSGFTNRVMFHFRKVLYTLDVMEAEKVIYILPPGDKTIENAFRNAFDSLSYEVFPAVSIKDAELLIEKTSNFLKA
jgi:hypothetical protein